MLNVKSDDNKSIFYRFYVHLENELSKEKIILKSRIKTLSDLQLVIYQIRQILWCE